MVHFKDDEFVCKCKLNNGKSCGSDITDELKGLMDRARTVAGVPFVITSGARCKDHNRAIGSKDTSSHTKGLAVDIKASGSRERSLIMNALCSLGITRFGIDKSFIHLDIDFSKEQNVTWLY